MIQVLIVYEMRLICDVISAALEDEPGIDTLDRIYDEGFGQPFRDWPNSWAYQRSFPLDMRETDEELIIEADLPGIKAEDVRLTVTGNNLIISGEIRFDEEKDQGNVHFQERRYGKVQRTISRPASANADAAEATFEDGVLHLSIPKIE